jgi:hypothetical protein
LAKRLNKESFNVFAVALTNSGDKDSELELGERSVVDRRIAAGTGGVDARRGVQFQGGPDSPDVVLDGVAIHVEAKRVERLQLWAAIEQAKKDSPPGKTPVVWHKANRRGSVVIVETAMLVDLAREIVRATS